MPNPDERAPMTAQMQDLINRLPVSPRSSMIPMPEPKPKTIYDSRVALDEAVRDAAPGLYVALKNLLEAVKERRGLPGIDSIETATIAEAQRLVDRFKVNG